MLPNRFCVPVCYADTKLQLCQLYEWCWLPLYDTRSYQHGTKIWLHTISLCILWKAV